MWSQHCGDSLYSHSFNPRCGQVISQMKALENMNSKSLITLYKSQESREEHQNQHEDPLIFEWYYPGMEP